MIYLYLKIWWLNFKVAERLKLEFIWCIFVTRLDDIDFRQQTLFNNM